MREAGDGMTLTQIIHGECLHELCEMASGSFDSIVTDPPAGIAFMGKDWDKDKGGRDAWISWMTGVMRECHRVLKPGAHGLVWALPRTSHWTATALEDAGFEIRDVVTHLFGTGFPKSLDVSKAIDKAAGVEREKIGSVTRAVGDHHYDNGTKMGRFGSKPGVYSQVETPITAPATDPARQWQGWGTALKPASEHWILIRKPLSEKTIAANVLKWGTGAINVDGCRVSHTETIARPPLSTNEHEGYDRPWKKNAEARAAKISRREEMADKAQNLGRFPANLVLDEDAAKMLDEQSGTLKTNAGTVRKHNAALGFGSTSLGSERQIQGDTGGASRFFYIAKASKSDRGTGNTHPTVKSTKLMAYLCRLVTPPGGAILDPFAGSGSTGVAAKAEGFKFVGIEQNAEYAEISRKRIG